MEAKFFRASGVEGPPPGGGGVQSLKNPLLQAFEPNGQVAWAAEYLKKQHPVNGQEDARPSREDRVERWPLRLGVHLDSYGFLTMSHLALVNMEQPAKNVMGTRSMIASN